MPRSDTSLLAGMPPASGLPAISHISVTCLLNEQQTQTSGHLKPMTKLLVPVFLPFIVWCIGGLFLENLTTTEHEVNGTGPSNSSQAYLWGLAIAIVPACGGSATKNENGNGSCWGVWLARSWRFCSPDCLLNCHMENRSSRCWARFFLFSYLRWLRVTT